MPWSFGRPTDNPTRWFGGWHDPKTRKQRTERLPADVATKEQADAFVRPWLWEREKRGEKVDGDKSLTAFLDSRRANRCVERTVDYYEDKLLPLFAFLAEVPMSRWTRSDVRRYIESKRDAWSESSEAKFLDALDSFIVWARTESDPPLAIGAITDGIKRPRVSATETETWTQAECAAILRAAIGTRLDLALHLNLCAAMSMGDIRSLTWEEIDRTGDPWRIVGVRHKRREIARDIPVTPQLRASLLRYPSIRADAPVCCGLPSKDPALNHAVTRFVAGVVGKDRAQGGFRRGRHSALSIIGASGADLATIRAFASHSPGSSVTTRYLHTTRDRLRTAADALAARLASG